MVKFPTYYLLQDFICICNISYIFPIEISTWMVKCQCFAQFSSSPTPLRLLEFSATSSNFSELPITLGFPAGHMSLQRSSDTDWGCTSTNTWSAATYGGFYGCIPVIPINNLKFTSKYGSPQAEPFAAQGRGGPSSSW